MQFLLLLFLLASCADHCPEGTKLKVTKIIACEDDGSDFCEVELEGGVSARMIRPKLGERICP